jgi:hypothetical protein
MISDIGLYLNWNPAPDDANEETIKDWNAKFEDELSYYERHEYQRYQNGDGFVTAALMGLLCFRIFDFILNSPILVWQLSTFRRPVPTRSIFWTKMVASQLIPPLYTIITPTMRHRERKGVRHISSSLPTHFFLAAWAHSSPRICEWNVLGEDCIFQRVSNSDGCYFD